MSSVRALALMVILLLSATTSPADVPTYVSFQGVLQDSQGEPISGLYSMSFAIYNTDTGGVELWSETRDSVAVSDGTFSVLLGEVNPLDEDVFAGSGTWIGITVELDGEMTPRQRMVTAPYAFRASKADTADYALAAEVGTHSHDQFYLGNVGPDTMFAMSAQPTLTLTNGGTGPALLAAGEIVGGFGITIAENAAIAGSLSAGDGFSASGNCSFDGSSVIDFEDGASVDFTGTSVTGLPTSPHEHGNLYLAKLGPDTITSQGSLASLTSINAGTGRALSGISSYVGTTATGRGLYGEANCSLGRGVEGFANSSAGSNVGVYGRSNSPNGKGLHGFASAPNGSTIGVQGEVTSGLGYGVYGLATSTDGATYGVYGRVLSVEGSGVYGWAGSDSGTTYGVRGEAASPGGYGVFGENANGYAGYFEGDVHLTGNLTIDGTYPAYPVVMQDSLYVNVDGPDSVTGSSPAGMLRVINSGTGSAIDAVADSGYALYASSNNQYAVYVDGRLFADEVAITSTDTSANGLYVQGAGENTAYVDGNLFAVSAVVQDSAEVEGDLTVGGALVVSTSATVSGGMSISGVITAPGPINSDSLIVNGDVHITGDLSVGGSYPGGSGGGPHDHDSLYVKAIGPDTMKAVSVQPTLYLSNAGSGEALVVTGIGDRAAKFLAGVEIDAELVVQDTLTVNSTVDCNNLTASSTVECNNLTVNGSINLPDYTGYASIGASEFSPANNGYDVVIDGVELYADSVGSSDFFAPVQLPHGSTVKEVSFYWYDSSVYDTFLAMKRAPLNGSSTNNMATLSSSGSGYGSASTAGPLPYDGIDNTQYTYYLHLTLGNGGGGALLKFRGAVVEYEFNQPF